MKQSKIDIFDQKTLAELVKIIRKAASKNAKIFHRKKMNKDPYCNAFTSLARLLSAREVCGCLEVKRLPNFNISLATNKEAKDGEFRERIGKEIYNLFTSPSEQTKLSLYRAFHQEIVQALTKGALEDIAGEDWLPAIPKIKKFLVHSANSESNLGVLKINWEGISLAEIAELKSEIKSVLAIKQFHEEERSVFAKFRFKLSWSLIYLEDLENVCAGLFSGEKSLLKEDFFTKRYKSLNNVHCELAQIELRNQKENLQDIFTDLNEEVKRKDFTVSKFCCYLCYLVFKSAWKISSSGLPLGLDLKENNFTLLGCNCAIYPTYKSISVEESPLAEKLVLEIKKSMEDLINKIKNQDYQEESNSFIENTMAAISLAENNTQALESITTLFQ